MYPFVLFTATETREVSTFVYISSVITNDEKTDTDIAVKIKKSINIYYKLKITILRKSEVN